MTENKNYRTQTSTSERNKLHLVFPGIWLAFQDVEDNSFSPWGKVPSGLLEITHCREGRLEYQDSHRAFFLGEGDLSIRQTRKEKAALLCTVKRYRGHSPGAGTSLHLLLFKGPAMKWKRSGKSPERRKGSLAGKEIGHSAKERRLNCAGRISG
jgi:hypothetical protein